MVRLLHQALNIRTGEGWQVFLLCLIHFIANGGVIWSLIITEAAFLQYIGVTFLPWVFVASPLLSITAIAVYSAFADRVSERNLLIGITLVAVFAFGGGYMLFMLGQQLWAFAIWYPLTLIFIDIFFTLHWGAYVNSFYDTQAAKRIFPIVSAAARIASIVAGATAIAFNRFDPATGILFWIGLLLMVVALAWAMPRLLKQPPPTKRAPTTAASANSASSYIATIREGFQFVRQSQFLRWMAFATLSISILFALLSYQAGAVFQAELQTVDRISSVTGMLNSLGNLLMFPLLLFGLSRIIGRIGVGNGSLIFPFGTLAISGALIAAPNVTTAGLAYFDRTAFRVTFHATFDSLLYNAVPLRVKGRARAFITGLVVPLGTLLGGLLLLALPNLPAEWWWALPSLIGTLALAYVGCAWMVRRYYAHALLTMLEQEDYSFLLEQDASVVAIGDTYAISTLEQRLSQQHSHELTLLTAKLLLQIGGAATAPAIERAITQASESRTRAALLELLVAADLRSESLHQLYIDQVRDADPQVRRVALAGLEQLLGSQDEGFLALALEMLKDPDVAVRVQVLPALARSGDFFYLAPAIHMLNDLLESPDAQQRSQAVYVLGQFEDARVIRSLTPHLDDPSDAVRLQVLEAIARLSQTSTDRKTPPLSLERLASLLHDPVERVRQISLMLLQHYASPQSYKLLIEALGDESESVRSTAIDLLAQVGRPVLPFVYEALTNSTSGVHRMAVVVLSRIDPMVAQSLVTGQIERDLEACYRYRCFLHGLRDAKSCASIDVLRSALSEQQRSLVHDIFFVLAGAHDAQAVRVIAESFTSTDARIRANATEALESLSSPQVARLIATLFEPEREPALLAIAAERWKIQPSDVLGTISDMQQAAIPVWLRALAIFALGELGTEQQPPPAPQEQPALGARRGRKNGLAALQALYDEATPQPPTTNGEAPPAPTDPRLFELLDAAERDAEAEVRQAAELARRMLSGLRIGERTNQEEILVLSTIEKVLFLKEVPFFQGMTVEQLKALATVCEEGMFEANSHIFSQGDPGGALYVVVNGRVALEQERRKGSFARLATLAAHAYFGEMNLFDDSPRSFSAIALQDTLTLRLRREPLIALARRQPDLSLELINVLSQRLREANDRIAELTRTKPRELHKLYDQFEHD